MGLSPDQHINKVYQDISDSFHLFLKDFEHFIDDHYFPLQAATKSFFRNHSLPYDNFSCSCHHLHSHGFRPFHQYMVGLARVRLVPEPSSGFGSTETSSSPPTPDSDYIPRLESFLISNDRFLTASPVLTEVSPSVKDSEDTYETPEDFEGSGGFIWRGEGGSGTGEDLSGEGSASH